MPSTIEVTNTNASGSGSLAAAVSSAQSGDIIDFAPSLTGQQIAVSSTLAFGSNVTNVSIAGPTNGLVTISGGKSQQVFSILANQTVTLSNLEIKDGSATTGAGITNAGNLTLNSCLLDNNTATAAVLGLLSINGGGGGIFNTGTLTVNNSSIDNNTVQNGLIDLGVISGGGVENYGGTVKMTNCTIADNSIQSGVAALTESGAGLENTNGGTMTLVNCTVASNTITALLSVAGSGGGVDNSEGSTLNLINTIVGNPNGASTGPDVNGSIANAINSLFGSSTQGQILNTLLSGTLLGDVFGENLLGNGLLGALGLNNNGSTPTLPLLGTILNNPAIGGGLNPSQLTSTLQGLLNSLGVSLPSLDQNGVDRALNFLDIGAFQSLLPTVTSVVGTPQNGLLTQLTADIAGPDGALNTLTKGVVTFLENGQVLGTANVVDGVAKLLTDLLSSGDNLVTAVFGGVDGLLNLGGSTSPPVTIVVNPPPSPGPGPSPSPSPGAGTGSGTGSGAASPSAILAAIEVAIDTAAILLQGDFAGEEQLQIASQIFLNKPLPSDLVSDLFAHLGPADGFAIPAIEVGIEFANDLLHPSS